MEQRERVFPINIMKLMEKENLRSFFANNAGTMNSGQLANAVVEQMR